MPLTQNNDAKEKKDKTKREGRNNKQPATLLVEYQSFIFDCFQATGIP